MEGLDEGKEAGVEGVGQAASTMLHHPLSNHSPVPARSPVALVAIKYGLTARRSATSKAAA